MLYYSTVANRYRAHTGFCFAALCQAKASVEHHKKFIRNTDNFETHFYEECDTYLIQLCLKQKLSQSHQFKLQELTITFTVVFDYNLYVCVHNMVELHEAEKPIFAIIDTM